MNPQKLYVRDKINDQQKEKERDESERHIFK